MTLDDLTIIMIYGFGTDAGVRGPMRRMLREIPDTHVIFAEHDWDGEKFIKQQLDESDPFALVGHSLGARECVKIIPGLVAAGFNYRGAFLLDPVPLIGDRSLLGWSVPAKPLVKCYHRKDHWFDGEFIDGHPVEGADNTLLDLGHSEFITDPAVLEDVRQYIELQRTAWLTEAV